MSKYAAIYRCQLCNKLIQFGEPMEAPREALTDLTGKVIYNQLFAGNPYLHKAPMHTIHECNSEGCGVAYFAGFKQIGG